MEIHFTAPLRSCGNALFISIIRPVITDRQVSTYVASLNRGLTTVIRLSLIKFTSVARINPTCFGEHLFNEIEDTVKGIFL